VAEVVDGHAAEDGDALDGHVGEDGGGIGNGRQDAVACLEDRRQGGLASNLSRSADNGLVGANGLTSMVKSALAGQIGPNIV
jgi:hypothetical protein